MSAQKQLELPEVERPSPRVASSSSVPSPPPESFDSLQSRLTRVIGLKQTFNLLKDKKTKESKDDLDALTKLELDHELLMKKQDLELAEAKQKVVELESAISTLKADYTTKKVGMLEKTAKYRAAVQILDSKIAAAVKEINELEERLKEFERPGIDVDLFDLPEDLRDEAVMMSQSLILQRSATLTEKSKELSEKITKVAASRPTPIKISEELTAVGDDDFEQNEKPQKTSTKPSSTARPSNTELAEALSSLRKSPLLDRAQEQAEAQKTSRKKKAAKKGKTTSKFNDVLKEDRGEISSTSSSSDDDKSEDLWDEKAAAQKAFEPASKKRKVESNDEFSTPTGKQADFEFDFKDAENAEERSLTKYDFELGGSLAFLNPDDDAVYEYEARRMAKGRYLVVIKKSLALKILKQAFKYQSGQVCSDHKKTAYKNFWDHYNYNVAFKEVEQEVLVETRDTRGNDCQLCGVSIKKGEVCAYANSYHEGSVKAKCTKHPLHMHCCAFLQALMKEDCERPCCIGNCYDSNNRDVGGKVAGCLLKS